MPNAFLEIKTIAREALTRLRNNLVFVGLVHTDYKNEFKSLGDTIQVKRPPVYEAKDFTTTISTQDINETSVDVKLDKIADVSIEFTSKQRALNIETYGEMYIQPAMEAIAQKIDADALAYVYKKVFAHQGTSGVTPDGLDDFAHARKALNINKVPNVMRRAVWDPNADAAFTQLAAIVNAEKSGSTMALREGSIGRIQGLDNYMSQNLPLHVAGSFTAVGSPKVVGNTAKGATTIAIDGGAGTEDLKMGDIFSIGTKQYVVTADVAAVGGAIASVGIYPVLQEAVLNDADVVFPDKTAGGHIANLAFHKNAFAFVNRPLVPPSGAAMSYTATFEGLSVRTTAAYDINTKKEVLSMDILYGYETIFPELAVRTLG
jgi:hypothetical protein